MLSSWYIEAYTADVNWEPLFEVMAAGTPKRAIQPRKRARALLVVDVEASGTASTHHVKQSMMVKRYVHHPELGKGANRINVEVAKAAPGTGMWRGFKCMCLVMLPSKSLVMMDRPLGVCRVATPGENSWAAAMSV